MSRTTEWYYARRMVTALLAVSSDEAFGPADVDHAYACAVEIQQNQGLDHGLVSVYADDLWERLTPIIDDGDGWVIFDVAMVGLVGDTSQGFWNA